jgi:hypothetical protein
MLAAVLQELLEPLEAVGTVPALAAPLRRVPSHVVDHFSNPAAGQEHSAVVAPEFERDNWSKNDLNHVCHPKMFIFSMSDMETFDTRFGLNVTTRVLHLLP